MSTLNISLPAALKAFVATQVRSGLYSSASDYVRTLIRADQHRGAEATCDAQLLAGLGRDDGAGVPPEVGVAGDTAPPRPSRGPCGARITPRIRRERPRGGGRSGDTRAEAHRCGGLGASLLHGRADDGTALSSGHGDCRLAGHLGGGLTLPVGCASLLIPPPDHPARRGAPRRPAGVCQRRDRRRLGRPRLPGPRGALPSLRGRACTSSASRRAPRAARRLPGSSPSPPTVPTGSAWPSSCGRTLPRGDAPGGPGLPHTPPGWRPGAWRPARAERRHTWLQAI